MHCTKWYLDQNVKVAGVFRNYYKIHSHLRSSVTLKINVPHDVLSKNFGDNSPGFFLFVHIFLKNYYIFWALEGNKFRFFIKSNVISSCRVSRSKFVWMCSFVRAILLMTYEVRLAYLHVWVYNGGKGKVYNGGRGLLTEIASFGGQLSTNRENTPMIIGFKSRLQTKLMFPHPISTKKNFFYLFK